MVDTKAATTTPYLNTVGKDNLALNIETVVNPSRSYNKCEADGLVNQDGRNKQKGESYEQ